MDHRFQAGTPRSYVVKTLSGEFVEIAATCNLFEEHLNFSSHFTDGEPLRVATRSQTGTPIFPPHWFSK